MVGFMYNKKYIVKTEQTIKWRPKDFSIRLYSHVTVTDYH
jgi:hypothetical protein